MTDLELIDKLIQKVKDGGLKIERSSQSTVTFFKPDSSDVKVLTVAIGQAIYDHDFAKALWGEEEYKKTLKRYEDEKAKGNLLPRPPQFADWQLHLMQMVIADDPFEYLKTTIGRELV